MSTDLMLELDLTREHRNRSTSSSLNISHSFNPPEQSPHINLDVNSKINIACDVELKPFVDGGPSTATNLAMVDHMMLL